MPLPANYPRHCPRGHRLGPGLVTGSWHPCINCGGHGHTVDACWPAELEHGCDWEYWDPPHDGGPAWVRRAIDPRWLPEIEASTQPDRAAFPARRSRRG